MVQKRKIQRKCVTYDEHVFKPIAIPLIDLEIIELTKEEITAIFYADLQQLKQIEAAEKMGISQASFSRELNLAHKKIADALFNVKAIQFGDEPFFKSESDNQ